VSNKLLSIIVPFYNVEKYIGECLNSVYNQDLPEEDYEVICVNDCSPDRSRDIVIEYQKKHSNLVLIEHDVNKMLGAARNTGLAAAQGKYIWFVDSDDHIEFKSLFKTLNVCENLHLEVLSFNSNRFDDQGVITSYYNYPIETDVISGVDYLENKTIPYWKINVTTWSKIYNREYLNVKKILFPVGVYFEDNRHTLQTLLTCERFKHINEKLYYYRDNPVSITNSNKNYGKKLGDKTLANIECLELMHNWKIKNQTNILDEAIDSYVYFLENSIKAFVYLKFRDKLEYRKSLNSVNRSHLYYHIGWFNASVYYYINVSVVVLLIPTLIIVPIRKLKEKLLLIFKHA
jgi:glycosyltransferase involved in cell wall biosynthesis